jgi:hypothetical protein
LPELRRVFEARKVVTRLPCYTGEELSRPIYLFIYTNTTHIIRDLMCFAILILSSLTVKRNEKTNTILLQFFKFERHVFIEYARICIQKIMALEMCTVSLNSKNYKCMRK